MTMKQGTYKGDNVRHTRVDEMQRSEYCNTTQSLRETGVAVGLRKSNCHLAVVDELRADRSSNSVECEGFFARDDAASTSKGGEATRSITAHFCDASVSVEKTPRACGRLRNCGFKQHDAVSSNAAATIAKSPGIAGSEKREATVHVVYEYKIVAAAMHFHKFCPHLRERAPGASCSTRKRKEKCVAKTRRHGPSCWPFKAIARVRAEVILWAR